VAAVGSLAVFVGSLALAAYEVRVCIHSQLGRPGCPAAVRVSGSSGALRVRGGVCVCARRGLAVLFVGQRHRYTHVTPHADLHAQYEAVEVPVAAEERAREGRGGGRGAERRRREGQRRRRRVLVTACQVWVDGVFGALV
jgi:hypothetical protein